MKYRYKKETDYSGVRLLDVHSVWILHGDDNHREDTPHFSSKLSCGGILRLTWYIFDKFCQWVFSDDIPFGKLKISIFDIVEEITEKFTEQVRRFGIYLWTQLCTAEVPKGLFLVLRSVWNSKLVLYVLVRDWKPNYGPF